MGLGWGGVVFWRSRTVGLGPVARSVLGPGGPPGFVGRRPAHGGSSVGTRTDRRTREDPPAPEPALSRSSDAEPQRLDPVNVHTLHHGVKTGTLIGKDKGQGQ